MLGVPPPAVPAAAPTMSGSSNVAAMKKVVQQLRLEASVTRVKVSSGAGTRRDGTGRTRRHYTVPRPRPAALLGGSRAARRGRGWAGADSPDLPWPSWAAVPRSRALAPGLRRASPAAQPGPFPLPPPPGARPERGPDWPAAPSRFLQPVGTPGLLSSRALLGDGRAHSPLHFLILEITLLPSAR